jgi:hypothetical protein
MKTIFTLLAGMIVSSAIFAQNEKQERNLEPFNQMEVDGNFTVIITQSDQQSVIVDALPNAQEKILTEVKNGVLIISDKGAPGEKKIEINVPDLSRIKQTGVTTIRTSGTFKTENLELESSGASSSRYTLETDKLKTTVTGAGDIRLKGSTNSLIASLSGAGNLRAYDLSVKKAEISISGAGEARVDVTDELIAKVSGAGKVLYKNEPTQQNVQIMGAGEVRQARNVTAESKADTTKLRFGNKNLTIISEEDTVKVKTSKSKKYTPKNHWAGIDLGVAGYLSPQQSFAMQAEHSSFELDYARSRTVNFNFLQHNVRLIRHNLIFVTGLGSSFTRYHFHDRQTIVTPHVDSTFMASTGNVTRKHFLSTTYLTAPLLLEINTHKKASKSFHLATGVIGGYRIGSRNVQVLESGGRRSRLATRDDFNLSPFNLNATVRIGYGNFNVFATYSLTQLFQGNRGPELYPVSAGITLIGF